VPAEEFVVNFKPQCAAPSFFYFNRPGKNHPILHHHKKNITKIPVSAPLPRSSLFLLALSRD